MKELFDEQMSKASDKELLYITGNRDHCREEKCDAAAKEAKKRNLASHLKKMEEIKVNETQKMGLKSDEWFEFG